MDTSWWNKRDYHGRKQDGCDSGSHSGDRSYQVSGEELTSTVADFKHQPAATGMLSIYEASNSAVYDNLINCNLVTSYEFTSVLAWITARF